MLLRDILMLIDFNIYDVNINSRPYQNYDAQEIPINAPVFIYHCDNERHKICITTQFS